jgi:dTDP-4-dehydrorhamnose reductase
VTPARVLVTGGGGQLASDLERSLASATVWAPPRSELDVTDASAVERAFEQFRPDTVFNCAAFHNVGVCESEEGQSFAVNATAVKRLAEHSARHEARLVHLSTNYVFDGTREEPYAEWDLPAPGSVYAISKHAGEHAALAYAPDALVVRTAGLYGLHGSASKGGNFVTRMVERGRSQGQLRMVSDQRLNPTYTADLAPALVEAVSAGAGGVVHLTNDGSCSWFEFTQAILRIAGIDASLEPVSTGPEPPARPLNGVLARGRVDELGIPRLRQWEDALQDYMSRADLRATSGAGP